MSIRKPPTQESLKRGGLQEFNQEKRRFMSPVNAMTNIAFRAVELINIVAPNMESGVTNFFQGYETVLRCTNSPHETCQLRVIENGQFVLVSDHHELGESITVGRDNRVLSVLEVKNNRIYINNECVFGSFPLNENNEHVAVLLPHGTRPDMVKSEFLHIELGCQPFLVQLEVSIDGGLYLVLAFTRRMLAFQRFDSASLSITMAQMFRSLDFEDMKKLRNINEFIDVFMGKAGINAIVNRRRNRQSLNDVAQNDEIGASNDVAQNDEIGASTSSHQSELVKVDVHNESKIVNPSVATTYLILPGGHSRLIPAKINVFYLGHLVRGICKLPDQMENELFHFGSEKVVVDRDFILNLVNTGKLMYEDVSQEDESCCSSASSGISAASVQTVIERQKANTNDSVMDWIEASDKIEAERLKLKSQQQMQTQSSGSKTPAASESEMMEFKAKIHQRIQVRAAIRALSNIN